MPAFSVSGLRIAGISACVPPQVVFTRDYAKIPESERAMFTKTVGVESRHVAAKGTTTLDLCVRAAEKLLSDLQWDRKEIQLEIFVTQSKDYYLPSNADIAQDKLRLPKTCMAFDIGLGCSGYVYGLSVAASILKASSIKKALLLVGDVSTVNCSYDDKSAYPLFGDAGTATAIELSDDNEKWDFNLYSDGSGYDSIIIPDGGLRNLISQEKSFEYASFEGGISRAPLHLSLKGIEIFNFSVREVPSSIGELMKHSEKKPDDFDYFILHQANRLMNETIRKKLGIAQDKVPYSMDKYGNTSSASIPLTIVSELGTESREKSLSLLMSGFGVGLSWGNVSLKTNKIICPDVIEY